MKRNIAHNFALVTGASEGIGRAIAEELASNGINLILVALPDAKLDKAAHELKEKYKVQAIPYAINLVNEGAAKDLFNWCLEKKYPINILVNNAGIGHEGKFETTPLNFIEDMMRLNMLTIIQLTHLFIPRLKNLNEAYILNVSSMASFRPIPYKNIYSASKSFIFYFSRALNEEMKDSPIKVSVLCPGPVPTNAKVKARMDSKGFVGKMSVLSPEKVARIAIEKMYKGSPVIIPGWVNRAILIFEKAVPRKNAMKILARLFKED